MADKNAHFLALLASIRQLEADNKTFFSLFDILIALANHSHAQISKFGDFCADRQQTKLIALPLVHAQQIAMVIITCHYNNVNP